MAKLSKSNKSVNPVEYNLDALYQRIAGYLNQARQNVLHAVDTQMLIAYWQIGRDIVEEEQQGALRAEYGKAIIQQLSSRLTQQFGKGYGISTLKDIRLFYLTYSDRSQISHAVRGQSLAKPQFSSNLSWTHYRLLMRVGRSEARHFYEVEASQNRWSTRELDRQISSLLFDRLAKSRDKQGLMELARKGQELIEPIDAIKDPVVLEFLGIPESHRMIESKLEDALINNLQHFLLELGTGFAFVARQKRITVDGDHFWADLVFYHTVLKCYIILDIKTRRLTHGDLGQMQFYVNYFDQEVATEGDNPTIGLILCTKKSDAMVKYTLGEKNKQIFASKYQFHLPTEEELERELKRELKLLQPLQALADNKNKD